MSAPGPTAAPESGGDLLRLLFRAHPWHGVALGPEAPARVTAYIEIVPTDTVKYEIDKPSGILKVDRPQQFSNVCPTLYGFLPQTYCGERVAALARSGSGSGSDSDSGAASGDGDPLDVCVLTEKSFSRGDVLLQAVPVGGLRLLDRGQADDKIVAVLSGDAAFGHLREIEELPEALLARLRHYFLTYKRPPGAERAEQEILETYGRAAAYEVIERSREDYRELHPGLEERLAAFLGAGREGGA